MLTLRNREVAVSWIVHGLKDPSILELIQVMERELRIHPKAPAPTINIESGAGFNRAACAGDRLSSPFISAKRKKLKGTGDLEKSKEKQESIRMKFFLKSLLSGLKSEQQCSSSGCPDHTGRSSG